MPAQPRRSFPLEVVPVTEDDEVEIEVEHDPSSADGSRPDDADHPRERLPPSTDRPDDALGDELGRIDLLTTPEGYVEGRVSALEAVDERTVRLEVTLPHEEVVAFTLEKPIPWSREFLLARIVEDVGYDAASIGHLVGEPIYVTRTDREARGEDDDRWRSSVRSASDAVVASLLSDRYRLAENPNPEWRLVDPLERASDEDDAAGLSSEGAAAWLVVIGTLAAGVGGAVGATGGLALSSAALAYAIPGLLLVLLGLAALLDV